MLTECDRVHYSTLLRRFPEKVPQYIRDQLRPVAELFPAYDRKLVRAAVHEGGHFIGFAYTDCEELELIGAEIADDGSGKVLVAGREHMDPQAWLTAVVAGPMGQAMLCDGNASMWESHASNGDRETINNLTARLPASALQTAVADAADLIDRAKPDILACAELLLAERSATGEKLIQAIRFQQACEEGLA